MKCSLSRYATYHGLALAADLASLALVGLGTLFFMDVDPLGLATGKLIQSHICPGISFFLFPMSRRPLRPRPVQLRGAAPAAVPRGGAAGRRRARRQGRGQPQVPGVQRGAAGDRGQELPPLR